MREWRLDAGRPLVLGNHRIDIKLDVRLGSVARGYVKIMSDYSCGWPLWVEDGAVADDWFAVEQGLSPQLQADLLALQGFFHDCFHWDGGWRSAGDEARYAQDAVNIFFRLKRELGDGWDVGLDLWPVTDTTILIPLRRRGVLPT